MPIVVKELTSTISVEQLNGQRPPACPDGTQINAIGTYQDPKTDYKEVWLVICQNLCDVPECRLREILVV